MDAVTGGLLVRIVDAFISRERDRRASHRGRGGRRRSEEDVGRMDGEAQVKRRGERRM